MQHGQNLIGDGLGGTLEGYVSVTNLIDFKRCLVHGVLGISNFTIFNIINIISDPLLPGIRLTDAVLGGENMM